MDAINDFFLTKLKWSWHFEYASIILIVAAALALILLITIIVAAARGRKKKRKIAELQAEVSSLSSRQAYEQTTQDIDVESMRTEMRRELEAEIRAEVANEYQAYGMQNDTVSPDARRQLEAELRAEIEPEIRAQIENEYVTLLAAREDDSDEASAVAAQEIARLNQTVAEQEKRIDDLNKALMQASTAHAGDSEDLFKTINELTSKNKQLQNDVTILRAENSQLKTQAKKEAVLQQARQKPAPKQKEEVRIVTKKPVTKEPAPIYEDDDNEYDNEFGDENSAVKVTLKFDRVKQNWVIYRSDTDRAYRRLGTKQDALPVAKDLARRLHAQLVVHKKDGKFQRI